MMVGDHPGDGPIPPKEAAAGMPNSSWEPTLRHA
jgi:hypothetical protein